MILKTKLNNKLYYFKRKKIAVYIKMLKLTISESRSTVEERNIDGYKNMSKNNSTIYLLNH